MSLLTYWRAHPPMHLLVQGIASGMAGKYVGESGRKSAPAKRIESADELVGILQSSGLGFGVIQQ